MRRLRKGFALFTGALFLSSLLGGMGVRQAEARVDPLIVISRQIHKPNLLIVLDTSGSLTGVPGGSWSTSSEVGVDCDNGDNCRGGVSVGTCLSSGKTCSNDNHCRTSTCSTGMGACTTNADCEPIAGDCSTGESCFSDADCPARSTGRCSSTSSACSTSSPCSSILKCSKTGGSCVGNADCKPGVCQGSTTMCTTSADCPYATSGGTCAWGNNACSTDSQCPVQPKVCSDNSSKTCSAVSDCGGTCKKSKAACSTSVACTKSGDSCDYSGKSCASPTNKCILPQMACNTVNAGNACQNTNTCVSDPNPCNGEAADTCAAGRTGDVCNALATTTGSRMCRLTLKKCTRDSDCTTSGDSCGPASSRFVIAKRVIRNVVSDSASLVNLGFMTFFQDGYFPYYTTTGGVTVTKSAEIQHGQLQANKCYSKSTGLKSTCVINGKTYTLRSYDNTRYLVKGSPSDTGKYVNTNYCGWFCSIPSVGTGVFKGAFYDYSEVQGATNTLVEQPTYQGKSFTSGGVSYRYYDARPDYYNANVAPPIETVNCGTTCSAKCGARWDTQLAPFLSTDDSQDKIDAMVDAVTRAMEPASQGGLLAYGGTPIGCSLENNVAQTVNTSAYHYMQAVKTADPLTCRQNYVLLITDGEANGPGDLSCGSSACSAADPVAAGCTCRAVTSAYRLRKNLGVRTIVVGFSTDAATGAGRLANDNIAKAGGTDRGDDGVAPFSYGATSEKELTEAIQDAIYNAVEGSYSMSPATASQGSQQGNVVKTGSYVLDSRIDFPTWKGHLVAYDVSGATPKLAWDAATKMDTRDWKKRNVYTSDPYNRLVKVDVDPATGLVKNNADLYRLGLGANEAEAQSIARWMMGDPAMKNTAVLGAIVNSTPLDVAAPVESPLPGGQAFQQKYKERAPLTYVGSDDGMLHAFFTRTTTVNGQVFDEGSEAFAYIPPAKLSHISNLYAQGGQSPDPKAHLYGLASSPKAKTVCVRNCNDTKAAVWKTVLVMTEGWGGQGVFALDVTDPIGIAAAGGLPFEVLWHSRGVEYSSTYQSRLGQTVSVPAFMFLPSDSMDDHRLLFSSGYPVTAGSAYQGRTVMMTSLASGKVLGTSMVVPSGSCTQEYTMLTDVAVSRLHGKNPEGVFDGRRKFLSAYFGDTWGNLWRFTEDNRMNLVYGFGCQHPLHFAPTLVQLDQDDPENVHAGEIYLIQATNSTLDTVTESFEPSRMVIIKEVLDGATLRVDDMFGDRGRIELTTTDTRQLCAVTDASGETCLTPLPSGARPLATPLAVPKTDGGGFLILSHWYAPAVAGCGKGATYFLMHEFAGNNVRLKQALKIADEPVTNPLIVAGKMMFTGSGGPVNISGNITNNFIPTPVPSGPTGDVFMQTGWSEVQ